MTQGLRSQLSGQATGASVCHIPARPNRFSRVRLDAATELTALLTSADLVIVRILGTARTWQNGLDVLAARSPADRGAGRRTHPRAVTTTGGT